MTEVSTVLTPAYRALALQIRTVAINGMPREDARASIAAAIDRIGQQIMAAVAWYGSDTRLVVLPEYALTGFPMSESIAGWAELAGIDPDGPEFEALGAIAQRLGIYLAGNGYERDPAFPGLYFQACWIIAPSGQVVLRYHRLHSMYSPSPYDVWDRYLDRYGTDGVLPVVRTDIGALGAVASEEILYPELCRALALRGAEVLVQPTSEASSPLLTPKAIARRARAFENSVFVVAANSGGITGIPIGQDSTNGGSEIVDYTGRVLAKAGPGESIVACAEIDLGGLRRNRAHPGMTNLLSRTKAALWAEEYARYDIERPGELEQAGITADRAFFARRQREAIERLRKAGIVP